MVSRGALMLVRPFFRYSTGRSAYVLRVVGNRLGPVLVTLDDQPVIPKATGIPPIPREAYPFETDHKQDRP